MKILVLLVCFLPRVGLAKEFITEYTIRDHVFTVLIKSIQTFPQTCSLKVADLRAKPVVKDADGKVLGPGTIDLTVSKNFHAECLATPGPFSGSSSFLLSQEEGFPALESGNYSININGENYGEVVIPLRP
jgi:hypothetical protein